MYDVAVNIYVNGIVKMYCIVPWLIKPSLPKTEHDPWDSWKEGEFASSQAFCFQKPISCKEKYAYFS